MTREEIQEERDFIDACVDTKVNFGQSFSCLMAQPLFYILTLNSGDGDGAGVARIEGAHRGRQGHLQEVPAQNVVRALPEVSLRTL